jgi:hypothetical protein
MKKNMFAALAFAALSAQAAAAPTWVYWTHAGDANWYLDRTSLKPAGGGKVALWAKYVNDQPDPKIQGLKTAVMHMNSECGAPNVGIDSTILYDAVGQIIATSEVQSYKSAPPGSVYEGIITAACEVVYKH